MVPQENMMDTMRMLVLQAPEIIALFTALILAIALWRRQPRAALLLLLGSALLLFVIIVIEVYYYLGPEWLFVETFNPPMGNSWLDHENLIVLFGSVAKGVAYILMACAAFVGRRPERPPARPPALPGD